MSLRDVSRRPMRHAAPADATRCSGRFLLRESRKTEWSTSRLKISQFWRCCVSDCYVSRPSPVPPNLAQKWAKFAIFRSASLSCCSVYFIRNSDTLGFLRTCVLCVILRNPWLLSEKVVILRRDTIIYVRAREDTFHIVTCVRLLCRAADQDWHLYFPRRGRVSGRNGSWQALWHGHYDLFQR